MYFKHFVYCQINIAVCWDVKVNKHEEVIKGVSICIF